MPLKSIARSAWQVQLDSLLLEDICILQIQADHLTRGVPNDRAFDVRRTHHRELRCHTTRPEHWYLPFTKDRGIAKVGSVNVCYSQLFNTGPTLRDQRCQSDYAMDVFTHATGSPCVLPKGRVRLRTFSTSSDRYGRMETTILPPKTSAMSGYTRRGSWNTYPRTASEVHWCDTWARWFPVPYDAAEGPQLSGSPQMRRSIQLSGQQAARLPGSTLSLRKATLSSFQNESMSGTSSWIALPST